MTIDEQEIGRHLAETAAQVSAPRFTAAELGGRIRRRRARAVVVAGAAVAVAAAAVAVPVALGGSGHPAGPSGPGRPRQSSIITAPPTVPSPGYSIIVNGRTLPLRGNCPIIAGERLTIVLDVVVPARKSLSSLWIGITDGMLAPGRHGPADMTPILVRRAGPPLGPGVHRFRMHWVAPRGLRAGDSRQLSVEWNWTEPGDYELGAEGVVLELNVAGVPGLG